MISEESSTDPRRNCNIIRWREPSPTCSVPSNILIKDSSRGGAFVKLSMPAFYMFAYWIRGFRRISRTSNPNREIVKFIDSGNLEKTIKLPDFRNFRRLLQVMNLVIGTVRVANLSSKLHILDLGPRLNFKHSILPSQTLLGVWFHFVPCSYLISLGMKTQGA